MPKLVEQQPVQADEPQGVCHEGAQIRGSTESHKDRESATDFHKDLDNWVSEVSEVFHYRVFIIELAGQLLYSVLGPLSTPILLLLYGGRTGLMNRGFWIFRLDRSAFFQFLTWAFLFASVVCMYFFDDLNEVTLIEKKLTVIGLLMRNLPVATKYAYTSTPTWNQLNTAEVDLKYRLYMNLLTGWLTIPAENFDLQAEVAFVTVVGSRQRRSRTLLKFLPWPRSEHELFVMRERVDITSKTMFYAPTGRILRESSRFRKAEKQQILLFDDTEEYEESSPAKSRQVVTDLGQIRAGLVNAESGRQLPPDDTIPQPGLIDQNKDYDLDIFRAASAGQAVPIQDLFLYMLRGVMRSERAMFPKLVRPLFLFTVALVLLPSFVRGLKTGGNGWSGMFGTGVGAQIAIIGMFPSAFGCFLSSSIFMVTGAIDVWRRRALMRSCAAMLSVQREFRRHCPAEVDMLPILDLSDVKTIVAWRKLRQLCNEWGKFFHVRIRAFTAQFLLLMLFVVGDLIAGMLLYPDYTDLSGVSVTSLAVSGAICALLMTGIVSMVFLGNEVNAAFDRHVYLLYRQRSLMLARRFGDDSLRKCESLRNEAATMAECSEVIAAVCEELDFEGKVKPLTLFGLRLGWSLLSALNFIPLGVGTTVFSFCSSEETKARCQI
ncbi:unnamed protein product [Symbiodinium natans]|uniref:Uncharacterized protein n=1 Tax=Symbiodinium natans TaxID=878477 RepID=A0A812PLK1_9DINO|nr:unnamed protein product [Symbiodinium natans]